MAFLSRRPARGNMNQGFGPRPKPTPTSPATHYGQDYGWGGGDAIYAAADGVIVAYAFSGAYGNRVVIAHGNGIQTWYCHTTSLAPDVHVGQAVDAGDYIAVMGSTGNVTGKHLHFELRINGTATNPEPYFAGNDIAGVDQTPVEDDDMFNDEDRWTLNNMNKAVAEIALRTWDIRNVLGPIQASGDVNKWALTDEANGLRKMVADLTASVGALSSGDITEDEFRALLSERPAVDADAIASAVATRQQPMLSEVVEAVLDALSTRDEVSASDVVNEIFKRLGELAPASTTQA